MKHFNMAFAFYFVAAIINWGYLSQRPQLWQDESLAKDKFASTTVPVAIAIVWPCYWICRGVLKITRP